MECQGERKQTFAAGDLISFARIARMRTRCWLSLGLADLERQTGSDDLNLNVNVLLQARYEGTFEGSVDRSFDSDFFLRRARLQASGTAYKSLSFLIQFDNSNMGKRASPTSVGA